VIKTYKIKHNRNLKDMLKKAQQVALFVLEHKDEKITTKHVKLFGLKSVISKAIINKYSSNKILKKIKSVKLTINDPSSFVLKDKFLRITPLKINFNLSFIPDFLKINQVEFDEKYCYISASFKEESCYIPTKRIGIDRNVKGHCVVACCPETGKVYKLGKKALFTHTKYKNIRKRLQKDSQFKHLKKIKNKESRIVRDLNHKISTKLVEVAKKQNAVLVLEDLKGIRQTKKKKSFHYSLNSWSFYQQQQFIDYKAKLLGVPIIYIDPRFTSQECSKCGLIGERKDKIFKCSCGHVEHADSNAGFTIAKRVDLSMFYCIKTGISTKALTGSACGAMQ